MTEQGHKENEPVISVIIPCYNCSATINNTLENLKKQTYKDFEVICINDGSTDGTQEILEEWKATGFLRLNVINKENGGVSSARNCGIDVAKGQYVVFLDSDDEYHSEYLAMLGGAVEQYGADTAYCCLDKVRDNVMGVGNPTVTVQTQSEAMHNLLYRLGEIGFTCYIYRRDIIQQENLRFDLNTKFGEDREFAWKYLCNCRTVCFIDAPMYWYRIVENSAINGKASWRRADTLLAVRRIEKYMEDRNILFLPQLKDYMFARHMWAVAKKFAVTHDKELFVRLRKEYDVKSCMKRTAKDGNKLVAMASRLYLIHPNLFYWIVGLKR